MPVDYSTLYCGEIGTPNWAGRYGIGAQNQPLSMEALGVVVPEFEQFILTLRHGTSAVRRTDDDFKNYLTT